MYAVMAIDPADETTPAKRKRYRRPPAHEVQAATPIWCPGCEAMRVAADFGIERRRFSGLKTRCRDCDAAARQTPEGREKTRRYNKKRWSNPVYREKALATSKARRLVRGQEDLRRARARLQAIVDAWKAEGCVDCGYSDIRAIDPDHRNSAEKVGHVSRMVQLCASAARIRAELDKCDPRCSRCHRMTTMAQRPSSWRTAERLPPSWRRRVQFQDRNDAIKLGRKTAVISAMIANGRAWTEIEEEMTKCEVVCANCHRIRTIERNALRASRSLGPTEPRDVRREEERRAGEPS